MAFSRLWQAVVSRGTFVLVVAAIGAALLGLRGLWMVEAELIARAGETLALGAIAVADKLDAMLRERDGDVELLAAVFQGRSSDAAQIAEHLRAVQRAHSVYVRLAVVDRTGLVVASTDQAWVGRDVRALSWFQAVWHAPRMYAETVTKTHRSMGPGQMQSVIFSGPIQDAQGTFQGAIMTEVDTALWIQLVEETVKQFAAQTQNFGTVHYRVLDADGNVLLTRDDRNNPAINLRELGLLSAIKVATGRPGYVEEEHRTRKVPVVTGYARMRGMHSLSTLQWGVLVQADQAEVLASIRSVLAKIALVGSAGIVLMLALIVRVKRSQHREAENAVLAQRLFRDRAAQLSAVVTSAVDGIISIDQAGRILSFNPAAEKLFGYSLDEVIGRNVSMLMPEPYQSEHDAYLEHYLRTGVAKILGKGREMTGRRRDGSIFSMDLAVSEMMIEGERRFIGMVRDVTERKQMVERLKEREMFYRLLSEHLPIGVFEIDDRGACLYVNMAWRSLFNLSDATDEVSSIKLESWMRWFHPDDREKVEEEWERTRATFERVAVECRLAEGGEEARWVNVLLWPMTTEEGVRFLGTLEDITEQKRTVAHTIGLLQEGRFRLRTLKEARNLAGLLSLAYPDQPRALLGISELLANAVEHGNLGISYEEKSELLSEGRFDDEISRRLALPEHVQKQVQLSIVRTATVLQLSIVDTGKGFDWRTYLTLNGRRINDGHGRGIAMAKLYSFDRVEYLGAGNHVVVSTRLNDPAVGSDEKKAV